MTTIKYSIAMAIQLKKEQKQLLHSLLDLGYQFDGLQSKYQEENGGIILKDLTIRCRNLS